MTYEVGDIYQDNTDSLHPKFYKVTEVHETHAVLRTLDGDIPVVDWNENPIENYIPAVLDDVRVEWTRQGQKVNAYQKGLSYHTHYQRRLFEAYSALGGEFIDKIPSGA